MEPEGSLPHSQVPATRPYPEPDRSSTYLHIPLPEIHLNIILPSTPGSPKWSLSLRFPHHDPVYTYRLPHSATCPAPLIQDLLTRTTLGEQYRSLRSSLCSFLRSATHPQQSSEVKLNIWIHATQFELHFNWQMPAVLHNLCSHNKLHIVRNDSFISL